LSLTLASLQTDQSLMNYLFAYSTKPISQTILKLIIYQTLLPNILVFKQHDLVHRAFCQSKISWTPKHLLHRHLKIKKLF